ncbi:hypothetical protein [Streptomyces sp. KL118A]|uniref:hypothetical protein n=1 Tax=Streptomyces sp. KL118A TaxID=3045153 RepID=UPI00278C2E5B|nr:hypothetical protein [Streptomyces sp. KL118A]
MPRSTLMATMDGVRAGTALVLPEERDYLLALDLVAAAAGSMVIVNAVVLVRERLRRGVAGPDLGRRARSGAAAGC